MTITSLGYPGDIMAGTDLAKWAALQGRSYLARAYSDWRVTAVSSGTSRVVQCGPGVIAGSGIVDTLDVATAAPALATMSADGSRWDLVVARRTWQTTNKTTVEVITGTSTKAIPTRNTNAGVIDDQPLALVRLVRQGGAYSIAPGDIVDLRLLSWEPGVYIIFDDLALSLVDRPGIVVFNVTTHVTRQRVYDATGARVWEQRDYSLLDHLLYGVDSTAGYTRLSTATGYGKGTQLTLRSNPDGSKPTSGDVLYVQLSDGTTVGATIFGVSFDGKLTHVTVPVELLTDPKIDKSLGSSASGWSTNAASESTIYTWGPLKQLVLVSRTSKSGITFTAKGGLTDTTIFTLTSAFRPKRVISTTFRYAATDGGQYGGTAIINPGGTIQLISGSPGTTIRTAGADSWSVVVDGLYMDF